MVIYFSTCGLIIDYKLTNKYTPTMYIIGKIHIITWVSLSGLTFVADIKAKLQRRSQAFTIAKDKQLQHYCGQSWKKVNLVDMSSSNEDCPNKDCALHALFLKLINRWKEEHGLK